MTVTVSLRRSSFPQKAGFLGTPINFLHRNLLEILLIFSPSEFWRSRFLSDRGKTTANPDGFARILTMGRRKYARQNHGSDIYSHLNNNKERVRQDPLFTITYLTVGYFSTSTHYCQVNGHQIYVRKPVRFFAKWIFFKKVLTKPVLLAIIQLSYLIGRLKQTTEGDRMYPTGFRCRSLMPETD